MKQTITLGVDPGLQFTGFALLQNSENKSKILDFGYLKLKDIKSIAERIHRFHEFFQEKLIKYEVTHLALETPFLGKNAQTFLKLGYLRGILYLLATQHKCVLQEFSPRQVKVSVTGFGGASKEQVALMIDRMVPQLKLVQKTVRDDVTDALAVSICGLWHGQLQGKG